MRMLQKAAHLEKAMDVSEAVSTTKKHVLKVFEDEKNFQTRSGHSRISAVAST